MATNNIHSFKCHFCQWCNGTGCIGQLPGMGGVNRNENFRLNCDGWEVCRKALPDIYHDFITSGSAQNNIKIRLAPITGAVENIGYSNERQYYYDMVSACHKANLPISIGDGVPDIKLQYGIEAVKECREKAAVFIKPYPNEIIFERLNWCNDIAEYIGIDIDSYQIKTMKNLVSLEKKTSSQLLQIKKKAKVPFVLKGIYTARDIELIKTVKPDILYVSNHGGRIETVTGSTAEFLMLHRHVLESCCGKIWIDGGIRTKADVMTAMCLGADTVLAGRPFISALCKDGEKGIFQKVHELTD